MRMLKVLGVAMLVVVVGGAVALAASDTASVNASFSIPSWIALHVIGNGDVSFADITGPGDYAGSNGTQLRVLSTTSWSLSDQILWDSSETPDGASQSVIDNALRLTYANEGTWGIHNVDVSYVFYLIEDDMGSLPEGDYNLVVQYTATTN